MYTVLRKFRIPVWYQTRWKRSLFRFSISHFCASVFRYALRVWFILGLNWKWSTIYQGPQLFSFRYNALWCPSFFLPPCWKCIPSIVVLCPPPSHRPKNSWARRIWFILLVFSISRPIYYIMSLFFQKKGDRVRCCLSINRSSITIFLKLKI